MTDHECSQCGGQLTYLGQLGLLCWLRCRDCGAECSRPAEEIETPQDAE